MPETSDFLILGGGSAGCVLAARLSEIPHFNVTLVEAGSDVRADAVPPDIASGYPGKAFLNANHLWKDLVATLGGTASNVRVHRFYEQARVLGGGSCINAMVANRGAPDDYDEWSRLGASGWSWDTVLPYFRKAERDVDFGGPLHGSDGPIPISRRFAKDQSLFVRTASETLEALGHVARDDQNGEWEDGIYPVTVARSEQGRRVPLSTAYLTEAVRARPNLKIITDAHASRILFDGRKAVGAVIDHGGQETTIAAGQVIVSAGALHTPALLMRSGIGNGNELRSHGIEVVSNLPGVGQNLMEHPSLGLCSYIAPANRLRGDEIHHIEACLRFSSHMHTCPPGDMHMAILPKSAWHGLGRRLGTLFIWVNKAFSRGQVTLSSRDPKSEPIVDFRLLSDQRDRIRLAQGLRLASTVFQAPTMRAVATTPFPAAFSDRVRKISKPSSINAMQTELLGRLLDWSSTKRNTLIDAVISRDVSLSALLHDETAMDRFIDASVGGTWHASGTCRMGHRDDPLAVTDPQGAVHGVSQLRVCDASLMPSIPRANTNMPTVMMAERLADMIKRDA